ncbi:MAG: hypothetical protein J1E16_12290 [Muribaculaceae bacterium]|nr:hypothetical protein [Muribaculaceae bacterium]
MDNPISNLIERIKEVNEILASRSDSMLSFEDCYKISQFYFEFQNTNRLIDEAERLAEENPIQLKDLAGLLKEKSSHLIDNLKRIKDVDFISIADKQTSLFYDRFQKAADELNPYWKRYCELNNRLDYLPLESEEYKAVEKECEAAKSEHDERQKEVKKLYADYQKEQKKAADLYSLKIPYLIAVVSKINLIAGSIITDLELFEKEEER